MAPIAMPIERQHNATSTTTTLLWRDIEMVLLVSDPGLLLRSNIAILQNAPEGSD
jgi:hypothetical protein